MPGKPYPALDLLQYICTAISKGAWGIREIVSVHVTACAPRGLLHMITNRWIRTRPDITATINGDTNKFEVCGEKSLPLCFSQRYSMFGNKCRGICYTNFPSCDRSVVGGALERVKSWVGACSAYRPNDHPPRLLLPCAQASTLQCGLFILTNGMLPCHQCLRNSHPSIHRLLDSRGYEHSTLTVGESASPPREFCAP